MNKELKLIKGYKCPKCALHTGALPPENIIEIGPAKFNTGAENPDIDVDPHYEWEEHIKCKCGHEFRITNGT